jgi:hypothetical protein
VLIAFNGEFEENLVVPLKPFNKYGDRLSIVPILTFDKLYILSPE